MSVDREITIRVLSNKDKFSDLFIAFVADFLFDDDSFIVSSLNKEDVDNYDYLEFNKVSLKPILDYRQNKGYDNYITFFVKKFDELIILRAIKLKENYPGYSSQYELSFTFGIGKRIKNSSRHTDFTFYLNEILPRFMEIGCKIGEIKCSDYDF